VSSWRDYAGIDYQAVHQAVVQQGHPDLMHMQADGIRVKGCKMITWMGLEKIDLTRLWVGGVVSMTRNRSLAHRLLLPVRAYCQSLRAMPLCTDG
jgi:hypothetical protein